MSVSDFSALDDDSRFQSKCLRKEAINFLSGSDPDFEVIVEQDQEARKRDPIYH